MAGEQPVAVLHLAFGIIQGKAVAEAGSRCHLIQGSLGMSLLVALCMLQPVGIDEIIEPHLRQIFFSQRLLSIFHFSDDIGFQQTGVEIHPFNDSRHLQLMVHPPKPPPKCLLLAKVILPARVFPLLPVLLSNFEIFFPAD